MGIRPVPGRQPTSSRGLVDTLSNASPWALMILFFMLSLTLGTCASGFKGGGGIGPMGVLGVLGFGALITIGGGLFCLSKYGNSTPEGPQRWNHHSTHIQASDDELLEETTTSPWLYVLIVGMVVAAICTIVFFYLYLQKKKKKKERKRRRGESF